MRKHSVVYHNKFLVNTLRCVGYNTYSAIADIIDNSIEPEVGATLVRLLPEYTGSGVNAKITALRIIDNGYGMSPETLDEAMALGSETGKNGSDNLGMYGTGLKTAAFSMGQTLEVYTKTENADAFSYARISISDAIRNNSDVEVVLDTKKPNEIKDIAETIGEHGTMVRISDLDHMKSFNYGTFTGTAEKRLSIIFSKFFDPSNSDDSNSNAIRIMVGNKKVPYVNVAKENRFAERWDSSEFTDENGKEKVIVVGGHRIRYNVWYSPVIAKDDESDDAVSGEKIVSSSTGEQFLGRQLCNQGFYLFRQNRLVGQALTLGIWNRHNNKNGLHIELFFDGNADYLFGDGFTKTTNDASDLKEELLSVLKQRFAPFAYQAKRRNEEEQKVSDADRKANEEFYCSVTEVQNSKPTLRLPGMRSTNNRLDSTVDHEPRGPQKNPNPVKKRNSQWLTGFEEVHLGEFGRMYVCEYGDGRSIVKINVDHVFYKEFYSKLDRQLKAKMAQVLSCTLNALVKADYYNDPDVQSFFEAFFAAQSIAVTTSLS